MDSRDTNLAAMPADLAKRVKRDRLFLNNPVVMQGLGLAPLVVAATNLENAVILSVALFLLLTPTRVLAAALTRFPLFRFRGLTYALCACVVWMGDWYVLNRLFTSADLALLGIYLPLLVADPIVLKRYERPQRERLKTALRKGLITSLGYILAMLVCAAVRELLGSGALMGHVLLPFSPLPIAQLPSGGFILLALIIAVWRGVAGAVKAQMRQGADV